MESFYQIYNNSLVFKGIDLSDCFILGWKKENDYLIFNLDLSVWPDSEYYEKPKKDEFTCYKEESLEFQDITHLKGFINQDEVKEFTIDPDGSKDWGEIYSLVYDKKKYIMETDFTTFEIECKLIKMSLY